MRALRVLDKSGFWMSEDDVCRSARLENSEAGGTFTNALKVLFDERLANRHRARGSYYYTITQAGQDLLESQEREDPKT